MQHVLPLQAELPLEVRFHPDGSIESGDQVSIEVFSMKGQDLANTELQVTLEPDGKLLGKDAFTIMEDGRYHAVLTWVWDTRALLPGFYTLSFSIPLHGISWRQVVVIQPPNPDPPEWRLVETSCCRLHYLTESPAEKDIDRLVKLADEQAGLAASEMGQPLSQKIDINLLPRVLGQGGFSSQEIYISYSDTNYLESDYATVLHHEMIHRIDAQINPVLRPLMLVEGLAVYLTGGHYKPEPILPRAAALPRLGWYVPLPHLVENFYTWQHEAGYLEAAALVEYMVNTGGRETFNRFYYGMDPGKDGGERQSMEKALREFYGLTLESLDDRFLAYLENFPVIPDLQDDLSFSAQFYEVSRQYQQAYDPSAYFREVWLPDAAEMRRRNIVADYIRRLETPKMLLIEQILAEAGQEWQSGNLDAAWQDLFTAESYIQ